MIVEDGEFCIPLHHGTSSIFLDSIEGFGLGAVNPIMKFDAIGFLRDLLSLCDEALANDETWNSCRFAAQWMVDQESFRNGANFQHGDTYLTPSRASAVSYALTNPLGSELVTQANRLYRLLEGRHQEALESRQLDRHPLVRLFGEESRPVLITVHRLAVNAVASESGGSPQESIDKLGALWNSIGAAGGVLNVNFRLRKPLPRASFSVEFVDPNREKNAFDW